MKKRILSSLLALAMLVGMLPTVAFATDNNPDTSEWTSVADTLDGSIFEADGDYQLTGNTQLITENITVDYGETLNLDLNGYTLTAATGVKVDGFQHGSVIMVEDGGVLNLYDSSGTNAGTITGGEGTCVRLSSVNSVGQYYGGGVFVQGGSFTMYGGTISDNYVTPDALVNLSTNSGGGGVCVSKSGTFTMNGGSISGNSYLYVSGNGDVSGGGGVYVQEATFIMNGGSISGNGGDSANGGGVCVQRHLHHERRQHLWEQCH